MDLRGERYTRSRRVGEERDAVRDEYVSEGTGRGTQSGRGKTGEKKNRTFSTVPASNQLLTHPNTVLKKEGAPTK